MAAADTVPGALSFLKYTASKGTIQISHSRPDTIGNFITCTIDFTLKDVSLQGPPGNSFSISNLQFGVIVPNLVKSG